MDSGHPAHHPPSYVPFTQAPFQVAKGSHSAPIHGRTRARLVGEKKKLLQQSPTCAAWVNARMNYGDARRGRLQKGKRSSHDLDVEFQEPRGPLRSPEPLLSVKQLSGPFPAPSA